jgi:hypothetical protein
MEFEPTTHILSKRASAHEDASRPLATTVSQISHPAYVATAYVNRQFAGAIIVHSASLALLSRPGVLPWKNR